MTEGGAQTMLFGPAVPFVKKSPPEDLEEFPKQAQTPRNFHFITSCFPENFPSLPIPGKIFRFQEEFYFSPETALLRVDTAFVRCV